MHHAAPSRSSTLLALCSLGAALVVLVGAAPPPELGRRGMVSSDHRLASQAGADVLEAGGNAVDAAVATALAAGVVQPAGSGLGGGGFAVVVDPEGASEVLDFREVAPAAADRDMYVRAAAAGNEEASRTGGLAVAVPAEGPGLATLHEGHGRLPLRRVVAPALGLARGGFSVGGHLAHALARMEDGALPMVALLFDGPARAVPEPGDRVRRSTLARTLATLARGGARGMQTGWVARDIAQAAQAAGGVLTVEDLAAYSPVERAPVTGTYRGWKVITMPPPSSGGAVLLQILRVLEGYDLTDMGHNSAEYLHLLAEASQHAYADRARYMGDPDRVEVPVARLISDDRVAEVQRAIVPGRTFPAEHYGLPVDPGEDGGTQHISVVDQAGLSVALTTTINTSFGSKVVAGESGIVLNNEMDDFVARPGVPNAYGLVGSEANAVAPGARPLSSMTPTVLEAPDGRRVVIGASGGPFIISSTLQAILAMVDFGLDPSEAVSRPRIHHQWQPRLLFVDEGLPVDVHRALRARGHELKEMPFFSSVQVAVREADGRFTGASDPRKGGAPAGAW